jgi:hypothetical protein
VILQGIPHEKTWSPNFVLDLLHAKVMPADDLVVRSIMLPMLKVEDRITTLEVEDRIKGKFEFK